MLAALAAPLLGGLLGWAGLHKLRSTGGDGPDPALRRLLPDARLVAPTLRALGALELALAAALLVRPMWSVAGYAAAALGVGFLGYLGWARAVAPDASCGCTSERAAPVTARSFGRAGLVVAGGLAAATADRPWWTVLAGHPVAGPAVLLAGVAAVAALSSDLDELWLLPLRRARLRLLGHPYRAGDPGEVPVAATVELLEQSLAWHTAAPVVRSALLEHWDDAGWRFLRFAGVSGARPVTVVFALAADATLDTTGEPAVRLTVVDDERGEVLPPPVRTPLPLAAPAH